MKRVHQVAAPPAVFAVSALLAWLTGRPAEVTAHVSSQSGTAMLSESRKAGVADQADILRKLERNLLVDAKPPGETYDGEELVRREAASNYGSGHAHPPMTAYGYSWAREAPAEMFAWLKRRGPIDAGFSMDWSNFFISAIFDSWAEKDMDAAMAEMASLTNREWHQQALASIAEVMVKSDPARARELLAQNLKWFRPEMGFPFSFSTENWDLLASLPPGKERTWMLAEILERGAQYDGPTMLAIWQKSPESLRREIVAAGFCDRYATDLKSSELPDGKKPVIPGVEEMLRDLAETNGDRQAAANLIKYHGPAWAVRDFSGALAWAQEHLHGSERAELTSRLFTTAGRHNFDEARDAWQSLPPGDLKAQAADALLAGAPADRREELKALLQSTSPDADAPGKGPD